MDLVGDVRSNELEIKAYLFKSFRGDWKMRHGTRCSSLRASKQLDYAIVLHAVVIAWSIMG